MKTLLLSIVTTTLASTAYAGRIDVTQGPGQLHQLSSPGAVNSQPISPGPGFGQAISEAAKRDGREFGAVVSRAARSGEVVPPPVAAVPLPAAAWLFGTAMVGLAVVSRKRG